MEIGKSSGFFSKNGRLKAMAREKYEEFVKTIPAGMCLFCEYEKYQIIIKEWKYWFWIQPISSYFKYHTMLCPKRHVRYLCKLSEEEKNEFWRADNFINKKYESIGVKKLRMQTHARYPINKGREVKKPMSMNICTFIIINSGMETFGISFQRTRIKKIW